MVLSNDELTDNLCRNLKQVRNIVGISMKELSEYLGVSRQTINNFENGKVTPVYSHIIATLAILDYKLKIYSPEWYAVQKILDISPEQLGVNSFLAYWFRLSEMHLGTSGSDNMIFSLYSTLLNEESKIPVISISEFVSRSDKIYIFADSLMNKDSLYFLDMFTKRIATLRKTLPVVILRTHLQSILESKSKENEYHVVSLYSKLNDMKEKGLIFIEKSIYGQENYSSDFNSIYSIAQTQNLFISVITENRDILARSAGNTKVFCMASFEEELKERR